MIKITSRFIVYTLSLLIFTSAHAALPHRIAERISYYKLCNLAIYEAKARNNYVLLPAAVRCLVEKGRIADAKELINRYGDSEYRKLAELVLSTYRPLQRKVYKKTFSFEPQYLAFLPFDVLKAELNKIPKRERLLAVNYIVKLRFYDGDYKYVIDFFDKFPEYSLTKFSAKYKGLSYYALGQWSEALDEFSRFKTPFFLYWQYRLLKLMGFEDETILSRIVRKTSIFSFYGLLARLSYGREGIEEGNGKRLYADGRNDKKVKVCRLFNTAQDLGLDDISYKVIAGNCTDNLAVNSLSELKNPRVAIRYLYRLKAMNKENTFIRPYRTTVKLASWAYLVDENLIYAVMKQESFFDRQAVSVSNAIGLMQVIPPTGRWISDRRFLDFQREEKLFVPFFSIDYGSWYLSYLMEDFDMFFAVAAYNAGPSRVRRWIGEHPEFSTLEDIVEFFPLAQTRGYVKKVFVNYILYSKFFNN